MRLLGQILVMPPICRTPALLQLCPGMPFRSNRRQPSHLDSLAGAVEGFAQFGVDFGVEPSYVTRVGQRPLARVDNDDVGHRCGINLPAVWASPTHGRNFRAWAQS